MSSAPAHQFGPEQRAGAVQARILLVSAPDVAAFLPALADVGGSTFTRPPWREPYPAARSVASRALADRARPGFVLALAVHGDEVYGFAYGHRCSALALLASRPPRDDFTLKELAVPPSLQGHGLGVRLHDAVLRAAGDTTKWLATHPGAKAAIGLYRRRGWRTALLHRPDRMIMRRD
ncbi:GNAT family N-acetyltransferase [Nonomuraea sp. NPDC050394]|uniref:GNAT family N-acetyltransferase n=1 Tax=Nonomuraea sp. NPDC050394 TaxID=3364363 RepID=UPI0037A9F7B4